MSHWTHITASIDAETYVERHDIKEYVEKLLEKAPKITGSECHADVFVNVLSGYNVSCYDGDTGERTKYQTRVVITVIGDLRDRMINQTEKEWNDFKSFIGEDEWDDTDIDTLDDDNDENDSKLHFTIRNCACNIKGA